MKSERAWSTSLDLERRFWPIGARRPVAERRPVVSRDRVVGGTCVLKYAPTSNSALADELRVEGAHLARLSHPALLPLRVRFDGVRDLSLIHI